MARYYLHLRDGIDDILDEEGVEYRDVAAVRKAVLEAARDVLANEIRSEGTINLQYRIDAEDADGKVVHSLPFTDAATVRR